VDARGRLTSGNYPYYALLPVELATYTEKTAQALRTGSIAAYLANLYMFLRVTIRTMPEQVQRHLLRAPLQSGSMNILSIHSYC
jgi:hypothetical protein